MEKREFDNSLKIINDEIKIAKKLNDEITSKLESSMSDIKEYLTSMDSRDSGLINYINSLEEFNFSDIMSVPLDLFPGIRTAKDMSDPEELKKKADTMKNYAYEVESVVKKNDSLSNSVSLAMTSLFKMIKEYSIKENQIYELCVELLHKLNSIYDISNIK